MGIHIVNLYKAFKKKNVFMDVNLELEYGKIYGFIGCNGSGKTVLFKCICGFLKADKGTIYIDEKEMGKDYTILPDAGIIIEEPAFLADKSGYQNLNLLYCIKNKKNKAHLYETMELVGLDPENRDKVKNYSLGMRQRLAIAQAIMEDQSILILDEPMNGLDKEGVAAMREVFLKLKKQGKLILLASHNREDIEMLCDTVYEIDRGVLRNYIKPPTD